MIKENVRLVFTGVAGGTTYHTPSWWALDEEGKAWLGPYSSKKELRAAISAHNRLVKSQEYFCPLLRVV